MTFEEWKEKYSDLIENVAITFFNYGRGVDTKTCYDELEYLLKKAFNAGKTKWHKIAFEGLPTDSRGQMYVAVDEYDCCMLASLDNGVWHNYHDIENVVAWCEVPKFKEE